MLAHAMLELAHHFSFLARTAPGTNRFSDEYPRFGRIPQPGAKQEGSFFRCVATARLPTDGLNESASLPRAMSASAPPAPVTRLTWPVLFDHSTSALPMSLLKQTAAPTPGPA